MKIKVTCPCGCGHTFEVEVETGKKTRNVSEETRAKRAEQMRAMRANGIGGRPKGSKNKVRNAEVIPEYTATETEPGVIEITRDTGSDRVNQFLKLCADFETDPKKCPLSMENGGPCDGTIIWPDGRLEACGSMLKCHFMYKKYKQYEEGAK